MKLWRISNYADLSGLGGLAIGGRWHEKGWHAVYTADHPASALLEVMVHLEIDYEDLPTSYQLLEIDAPSDVSVKKISLEDVEKISHGWRDDPTITRGMLVSWFYERQTALIAVPSAIVPHGSNYILNPQHGDAARVTVVSATRYPHDQRLFGRGRASAAG